MFRKFLLIGIAIFLACQAGSDGQFPQKALGQALDVGLEIAWKYDQWEGDPYIVNFRVYTYQGSSAGVLPPYAELLTTLSTAGYEGKKDFSTIYDSWTRDGTWIFVIVAISDAGLMGAPSDEVFINFTSIRDGSAKFPDAPKNISVVILY